MGCISYCRHRNQPVQSMIIYGQTRSLSYALGYRTNRIVRRCSIRMMPPILRRLEEVTFRLEMMNCMSCFNLDGAAQSIVKMKIKKWIHRLHCCLQWGELHIRLSMRRNHIQHNQSPNWMLLKNT